MNMKIILSGILIVAGSFKVQAQHVGSTQKKPLRINPAEIVYPTSSLVLFPNPASTEAAIKLDPAIQKEGFVLQIHNSSGVLLTEKAWTREKLDISGFSAGTYLVTLKRKQEIYSQKLVVNR